VNPILAGVALAIVAGAVVAVSARSGPVVVLALGVVLVATPALADPPAEPLALAARLIGAVLATYLLWIAVRDRTDPPLAGASTGGSRIGWPAEALVAAAAAIVGFASHGLGAPAAGPMLASAAGFAVAAVALTPVLTGTDILRTGTGLVLLLDGALLVRTALGGTPAPFEQLLTTALIVVLAGVLAVLALTARADGVAGFAFADDRAARIRREPDAHPLDR
jgi:hypothetical protein